jgi:tetrahydromethanopterin S-methyltransferase subunit G
MKPQPYRCPLGKLQAQTTDLDAVKEAGWREQHILVVNEADERLDFVEREIVRRIGERLYGRKRHG